MPRGWVIEVEGILNLIWSKIYPKYLYIILLCIFTFTNGASVSLDRDVSLSEVENHLVVYEVIWIIIYPRYNLGKHQGVKFTSSWTHFCHFKKHGDIIARVRVWKYTYSDQSFQSKLQLTPKLQLVLNLWEWYLGSNLLYSCHFVTRRSFVTFLTSKIPYCTST